MPFMDKDFLLETNWAKHLFSTYAEPMPIFDFHCHLNPREIYENQCFESLTQAWLGGDHYKWRAMRACGFAEELVTGSAPALEKFKAYAQTLNWSPGNPLYHWSHLELQRYFNIHEPLTQNNAEEIYNQANQMLQTPEFKVRNLIAKSNVKLIFTTDDPADDLKWHGLLAKEALPFAVKPAWRPDNALNIDRPEFAGYIARLGQAANREVASLQALYDVLVARMDHFAAMGCKASDHAFIQIPFAPASGNQLEQIFSKALKGDAVTAQEAACYRTALMQMLAGEYSRRGWVMEIHPGILRNNNTKRFLEMGPDTGYDSIADGPIAQNLSLLLNSMESAGSLPKTVLFAGNENDYGALATLMGCFQSAGSVSKLQLGTSWWFNDTLDGMEKQMRALGNVGVLGKFIGMLTDSRSFLSYPRHEYFRRIFCNLLGGWVEKGMFAEDEEQLGKIVTGVCYQNALAYFGQA